MQEVLAIMRDGREIRLAHKHGESVAEVINRLTAESLTGSAVPLAEAELETADGRKIRYADVNMLQEVNSFL